MVHPSKIPKLDIVVMGCCGYASTSTIDCQGGNHLVMILEYDFVTRWKRIFLWSWADVVVVVIIIIIIVVLYISRRNLLL